MNDLLPSPLTRTEVRRNARRLSTELAAICRAYHTSPMPEAVVNACHAHGFTTGNLDGIYCGRDGRIDEEIGHGIFLHLTWHRMEVTGTFEVVAYAN